MDIHNTDTQAPRGPAHVYLLQVDPNFSPESQAFPLQLLHNTLEYGHEQYLLPILPARQNDNQEQLQAQEQLQVLIGANQKNPKAVSLVDKSNQDIHKQYVHMSSVQPQPSITSEHDIGLQPSVDMLTSDLLKTPLNYTNQNGNLNVTIKLEKHPTIENYVHISDRNVPPRAIAVLPPVLQIRARDVIYPRRALPANARFGPVEGIRQTVSHKDASVMIINANTNKTPLFLLRDESCNIVNIDMTDKDKSNWIGLLPLGDETTANVWLYEENHQLYAITTESIPSRKTLMLGYSKKYAEDYGFVGQATKDIGAELSKESKTWWCYECQRTMPSAPMLQRHLDVYHRDVKPSKRRYQCRLCTRTFSRLFTLRRHRVSHCTKRPDISENPPILELLPELGLNSVPNTDYNRISSDESFQNYSNGLDFSTTLFDTDRIPGLDISGNSRSEGEFNPYSIGYKDDNALANDLEFTNPCSTGADIPQTCYIGNKTKPEQIVKPILSTCIYCNEVVVKENKKQHIRECSARRFECECGKVFTNKKQMAEHIHKHHLSDLTSKTYNTTTAKNNTQYKCEKCQHAFKTFVFADKSRCCEDRLKNMSCMQRRGMLVNHLWRVHKTVSTSVPLEKRVRHYPCVACPKIYRAAAKRDRHVAIHHPGADKQQAQSIEGGVRSCEPAQCPACPRQYCTRAKLLQHQRQHHPHLPTPSNKKPLKPKSNNAPFEATSRLICLSQIPSAKYYALKREAIETKIGEFD